MLAQELLEVAAGDVAHRDVELALVLAGVVDRDDVRMVERGGELRLAQEALSEAPVLGQLRCEQLEGDLAVERKVVGPVDDAHPAAAEQRLDPVAEELRADARVCRGGHDPAAQAGGGARRQAGLVVDGGGVEPVK